MNRVGGAPTRKKKKKESNREGKGEKPSSTGSGEALGQRVKMGKKRVVNQTPGGISLGGQELAKKLNTATKPALLNSKQDLDPKTLRGEKMGGGLAIPVTLWGGFYFSRHKTCNSWSPVERFGGV